MRRGSAGFNGGRLREARDVRGLTAVALAEIVGVSPQAISQYETGRSSPSQAVLQAIATAVNLPEPFFLRPPRMDARAPVFYRSMSSATKAARARAERRFTWLRDIVSYLSEFVDFPAPNFPSLDVPDDPLLLSDEEIEGAADEVRRYWSLTSGPIGNVMLLLENQGAIMAMDKLGAESLDGLSEFVAEEHRPYVIVGTDKGSSVRWRFDAAHELGHVVLHAHIDARSLSKPEQFKKIEAQAHRFAAAFLLPITSFGEDLFALNLDALQALKPKWKVSISMMIIRARHAGLLSEETERKLWLNYSRRGWRRSEPYDDSLAPEEPRMLRRAMELLLTQRTHTPDDVVASLALPSSDIESLVGLPLGYMSQDFSPVALRAVPDQASRQPGSSAEVIRLPTRPRQR